MLEADFLNTPWAYALLLAAGFFSGLVDSMAGGGGLISLPILLNLGLPVPLALGTNKFQASFGAVSATRHYLRSGVVRLQDCKLGIRLTFAGSLVGTVAVSLLDPAFLGKLVPWLLAAIVVYSVFKPRLGQEERPARLRRGAFYLLFGLGLGFYDGFFGPGTGSFWTIALVLLLGQDFLTATGYTKVMNTTSNLASLGVFLLAGQIVYSAGLVMAFGQILGSRLGAGLVVKRGSRFVQPIFLTMVTLTVGRLIWVNYLK